jgi:hypothetical protein
MQHPDRHTCTMHPENTNETYLWNIWNTRNIRLQHASKTIATYQHVQHLPIYFCNIHMKQMQHTFEMHETLETYICNIGGRESLARGALWLPRWGKHGRRRERGCHQGWGGHRAQVGESRRLLATPSHQLQRIALMLHGSCRCRREGRRICRCWGSRWGWHRGEGGRRGEGRNYPGGWGRRQRPRRQPWPRVEVGEGAHQVGEGAATGHGGSERRTWWRGREASEPADEWRISAVEVFLIESGWVEELHSTGQTSSK